MTGPTAVPEHVLRSPTSFLAWALHRSKEYQFVYMMPDKYPWHGVRVRCCFPPAPDRRCSTLCPTHAFCPSQSIYDVCLVPASLVDFEGQYMTLSADGITLHVYDSVCACA